MTGIDLPQCRPTRVSVGELPILPIDEPYSTDRALSESVDMEATRILADTHAAHMRIIEEDARAGAPGRSARELLEDSCNTLDAVLALPPEAREQLQSHIGPVESRFLHSTALSMAAANLNWPSTRWLSYGLLALAFENCADDWRYTTAKVGLLYHSARETGNDLGAVFEEVRCHAPAKMQQMIDGYIKCGVHDIRALGWEEATMRGRRTFKPLRIG